MIVIVADYLGQFTIIEADSQFFPTFLLKTPTIFQIAIFYPVQILSFIINFSKLKSVLMYVLQKSAQISFESAAIIW